MILHYIPKDQLRQHWDYVRHGLEIVRQHGHMEYIAEDVYCDCHENRAMLFICVLDKNPIGFVVLQPIGNSLHVWATYSTIYDKTIFYQAWQEIQQIARQGSKTRVTFSSQRKGWERRARALGFKPQTWEYTL